MSVVAAATDGPQPEPPAYYCPGCGARYFAPGICTNQHQPIELVHDPAIPLADPPAGSQDPEAPAAVDLGVPADGESPAAPDAVSPPLAADPSGAAVEPEPPAPEPAGHTQSIPAPDLAVGVLARIGELRSGLNDHFDHLERLVREALGMTSPAP